MKRKLDLVKKRSDTIIKLEQTEAIAAIIEVKSAIDSLYEYMNDKEDYDFDKLYDQLEQLNKTLDFKEQLNTLSVKIEESKVETVSIKQFGELLDAVKNNKPLPLSVDFSSLEKAIIQVQQRIQEAADDSRDADDFKPFRRVIKVGNRLVYDDQPTPSRGGGGSSSSSSSSSSSVTVSESALPTGASTSAKQDTQQTALDAIKTSVEALDNAVAGNELQVDVLTMPTTTVTGSGTFTTKEVRSATPSQSSVNDTASSTTLISSNANRLGATVFNDSTVVLYVKLGATASTTSFTIKLDPGDYYEIPFGYTGVVDGIWASDASGAARITELTT